MKMQHLRLPLSSSPILKLFVSKRLYFDGGSLVQTSSRNRQFEVVLACRLIALLLSGDRVSPTSSTEKSAVSAIREVPRGIFVVATIPSPLPGISSRLNPTGILGMHNLSSDLSNSQRLRCTSASVNPDMMLCCSQKESCSPGPCHGLSI